MHHALVSRSFREAGGNRVVEPLEVVYTGNLEVLDAVVPKFMHACPRLCRFVPHAAQDLQINLQSEWRKDGQSAPCSLKDGLCHSSRSGASHWVWPSIYDPSTQA